MVRCGSDSDETPGGPADALGLFNRPAWHAAALCRSHPEISWFPNDSHLTSKAKRVCRRCPVLADCRGWAAAESPWNLSGVWGGMSQDERIVEARLAGRRPQNLGRPRRDAL